jgi:hypothetical protein
MTLHKGHEQEAGWQSIETAPKDGTKFLAARFVGPKERKPHSYMAVDRWHSRERGDNWDGLGRFNAQFWPATHWMPLPPPPASQEQEK